MKILITGGGGLLGQFLNLRLSVSHNILTLYHNNIGNSNNYNSALADITDYKKVNDVFAMFKPDILIHAAAISSPQKAAQLPAGTVYKVNVNATKNLAELSDKYNAKLIYTSTDLVYAGYRGSMLNEEAKLIPVSLYAETKLMGEQKIKDTFDNYVILRTALLFGFGLNESVSHFHEMYLKLKNGEKVKLFTNQYRTPVSLLSAARMIDQIVGLDIKNEVLNFGGKERISRLELGERLCEIGKLDKNLIEKISQEDIPGNPFVADVSMNTDKIKSFGIKQQSIDDSINEILLSR